MKLRSCSNWVAKTEMISCQDCRRLFRWGILCQLLILGCFARLSAVGQTAHFTRAQVTLAGNIFGGVYDAVLDNRGNLYVATDQSLIEIPATDGSIPLLADQEILATVSNGLVPGIARCLAVDENGDIFFTDLGGNSPSGDYVVKEIFAINGTIPTNPMIDVVATGFDLPHGLAIDKNGDVFVADSGNNEVKEIVAVNGIIPANPSIITLGSGFNNPEAIAFDQSGDLFVADSYNNAIKELQAVNGIIPTSPLMSTVAEALDGPGSLAVDASGDLFFGAADGDLDEILSVDGSIPASPAVATVIPGIGGSTGIWGAGGIALTADGNVIVADPGGGRIVKEYLSKVDLGPVSVGTPSPVVSMIFTFDSSGTPSGISAVTQGVASLDFSNSGSGYCASYQLYGPGDTCSIDVVFTPKFSGSRYGAAEMTGSAGNLIATGYLQGTGVGPQVNFTPGAETGIAISDMSAPIAVAVDAGGNVFTLDDDNDTLVKETFSGGAYTQSIITSGLQGPRAVAVDGAGNVYVADMGNERVLKESPSASGYVESIIGNGFGYPYGVAVDGSGNVYVADDNTDNRIVEESPSATGYIQKTVVSGLGGPLSVAVDGSGNLYISDNGQILKETLSEGAYTQSVIPVIGQFLPQCVAVDGAGNVYFIDDITYNIFKESLTPSGYVESTTVSDLHIPSGPWGVAVDPAGNVYAGYPPLNEVVKADFADAPSLKFAKTAPGATSADSPQTVTLLNLGNADLTLPIPASGSNPNISTNFTLDDNAPSACPIAGSGSSSPGTLASGASCALSISFLPTMAGDISGSLILTDNNLNAAAPGYASQSIALSGTATQATPTISWSTPAAITYGTALNAAQLSATANVPGTFSYAPAAGTVLNAGTQTLTVTFTPSDTTDYTTATATATLIVDQATPVITWPTPAPIHFGTALSLVQLDATANVPGAFVYNPPAGTIPAAGTDTLSVTFTPADAADYTTAAASVALTVNNPSFTLSASPGSLSIAQGGRGSTTISVAGAGGFSGSVVLAVSGLPRGVTASFGSNPVTGATSMTLNVARNALKGTTTLPMTGTSGNLSASTAISLSIVK